MLCGMVMKKSEMPTIPKYAEELLRKNEERFDFFVRQMYYADKALALPCDLLDGLDSVLEAEFFRRVREAGWKVETQYDERDRAITVIS
jgi:hypothetical protein